MFRVLVGPLPLGRLVSIVSATESAEVVAGTAYDYHPRILEELAGFGLRPRPSTSPALAKAFVNDLYRRELRRLRRRLRSREIPRQGYADRVVALRKKYFLLSIRLDLWARPRRPDQAMVTSGDR